MMSTLREWAHDTRANTTIPALFAGGFLIGAVWYLAGLGDAMVFHETMQDAADATSFAPSVMHARGMNVLALLNLVMSAVLAILVAVKIVQLLLLAATVTACALPHDPRCPLLSSWQAPYGNFTRVSDRTVSTVNRGLYKSETALAKTIPVIGQAKAEAASRSYGPVVEGGFVAGLPLVPGTLEGGAASARWGLPVEDEAYENLCLQASDQVRTILFKPLHFLPGANVIVQPILHFVSGLVDQLVRSFPGYFCGGNASGIGSLGGVFKDIAKRGVAKVAENACKKAMDLAPDGRARGIYGDPLSVSSCTSGLTSSITSIAASSALTGDKQTSKRPYRGAPMGSDHYASFGFVFSRHLDANDVDAGLTAASWDRLPAKARSSTLDRLFGQVQFSKTEFYYDPRRGGPTVGAALSDESMHNMRWRARLRRYRPPAPNDRALLAGAGLGSIVTTIRSAAPGMNPAGIIGVVLGSDPEGLAGWVDRRVGPTSSRATGGVLH